MKENNISCIGFTECQGSNGAKFLRQLKAALVSAGYDLNKGYNGYSPTSCDGISFSTNIGCLNISIGTF